MNKRYQKVAFMYFLEIQTHPKIFDRMGGQNFPHGCSLEGIAGDTVQKVTALYLDQLR